MLPNQTWTFGGVIPSAFSGHSMVPMEQEHSSTDEFLTMWSAVQNFEVSTSALVHGASELEDQMTASVFWEQWP